MQRIATTAALLGVLGVTACAVQPPSGPTFAAMPGQGKTYEQFQADDLRCRQTAIQATNAPGNAQAAEQNAAGTAVAGTALGAVAGALIGSATGHVGAGAAIGAGAGLLAGSAAGANGAAYSQGNLQRNYDIVYAQCMGAAGNSVPPVGAYPGYSAVYPVAPAYAVAPVYYPPPVAVGFGFGWGYHRHYW